MAHTLMKSQLPRGDSKLARWCRDNNMSATGLGSKVGRSQAMACNYLREISANNFHLPPPDVMMRIFLLTKGEVTPSDFYEIDLWDARLAAQNPPVLTRPAEDGVMA